jgi:uncharacterized protein
VLVEHQRTNVQLPTSLGLKVVWDEAKNDANTRKHRVSFEQASRIFSNGVDYLEIFDDQHSEDEDRFLVIGPIHPGVIVVAYTEGEGETVRIISARRATRREAEW